MIELILGDCLKEMDRLISKGIKVDAVITDPPYGTTNCKWDNVIPFEPMWKKIKALRQSTTPIVLFGSEPFSSALRISNIKEFRYDWIWEKEKATRFLDCNRRPLQSHETISIFYQKQPLYNPQKTKGTPYDRGFRKSNKDRKTGETYGIFKAHHIINSTGDRHPRTNIFFNTPDIAEIFHPTQKPVKLIEFLIKTYTNEEDLVLDFTMGSGTTGVACIKHKRNFIGIENDEQYFSKTEKRIQKAINQKSRELF